MNTTENKVILKDAVSKIGVAVFGGSYQIITPDNESKTVCGTSFATAQVSGMVARMLAVKPELTMKQVFAYLEKYAAE